MVRLGDWHTGAGLPFTLGPTDHKHLVMPLVPMSIY